LSALNKDILIKNIKQYCLALVLIWSINFGFSQSLYLDSLLHVYEKSSIKSEQGSLSLEIAIYYQNIDSLELAKQWVIEAEKSVEYPMKLMAKVYYYRSQIEMSLGNLKEALITSKRLESYGEGIGSIPIRINAKYLIAHTYLLQNDFRSARLGFKQIIDLSVQEGAVERKTILARDKLVMLYYENGQLDSAIYYINYQRDLTKEEVHLNEDLISMYLSMAEISISGNDFLTAENLLKVAYNNAEKLSSNELMRESVAGLHYLKTIQESWEEADYFNVLLDKIDDSLNSIQQIEELNQLQTKFDIALVEHQLEKKDIMLSQQRLITWVLVFSALIIFGISLILFRQKQKLELLKSNLEDNLNLLEGKNLRNQMNPHFIFNSLNSINSMILKEDRFEASSYLTRFGKLMRSVLNYSNEESIKLSQELANIELYMNLEKLRLKNKLNYVINNRLDHLDYLIPPLIIQPFVENAIWHGIMNKPSKAGEIKIELLEKQNNIQIRISDDGIGRLAALDLKLQRNKPESKGSTITENRLDTLNALHENEYKVEYIDSDKGTEVILIIPKKLR
jgi:hypothetical protein